MLCSISIAESININILSVLGETINFLKMEEIHIDHVLVKILQLEITEASKSYLILKIKDFI